MVFQLHTFLFADLVGFTRFTALHGDERAADLAVSFHERVAALAASFGCQVVKTIGDAVMIRSEDGDAAIGLAKAILGLVGDHGFPLIRVGLDTGPAVERDGDWFGSTVNAASRVTSAAAAGELLITERTRAVCAAVSVRRLRERGIHDLRGLPARALYGEAPAGPPRAAGAGAGQCAPEVAAA
jgi:class 3 adenylate cyclase